MGSVKRLASKSKCNTIIKPGVLHGKELRASKRYGASAHSGQAGDSLQRSPSTSSREQWPLLLHISTALAKPYAGSPPLPGAMICSVAGSFCTFQALQSWQFTLPAD